MTSDFALNNLMISKEEYLDKKAYYDYQRKVEWNREKCMKICEDLNCLLYTSPSPRDQRGSGLAACA